MPENPDYEDILSGTVSEAKSEIQEVDDADYRKLLQLERENKNRKTLKDWLEERVEDDQEVSETETPVSEQEVPETLTRNQMLAGGFILGTLLGLVVGALVLGSGGSGYDASSAEVQDSVQSYADQVAEVTPQLSSADVTGVSRQSGMYLVNVTVVSEVANQTTENVAGFYVSGDGRLLFPARSSTNLETASQQIQQPSQPQTNGTR